MPDIGFVDALVEDVRNSRKEKMEAVPFAEFEGEAKKSAFNKLKMALEADDADAFFETWEELKTFSMED